MSKVSNIKTVNTINSNTIGATSSAPSTTFINNVLQNPEEFFRDEGGRFRCRSLFVETNVTPAYPPIYTLKRQDTDGYLSFPRLYLSYEDPTEYQVAVNLFGGMEHWERVVASPMLRPYIEELRKEVKAKIASQAMEKIRAEAESGSAKAYEANKFLYGEFNQSGKPHKPKRGRPSKSELEGYKKQLVGESSDINDDLKRLNI